MKRRPSHHPYIPLLALLIIGTLFLLMIPRQVPFVQAATARDVQDQFSSVAYTNSDGSTAWRGPWYEFGENDGPAAGGLRIETNMLRVGNTNVVPNGYGLNIFRQANLAGASAASLSFAYQRVGLDDATDYVAVEISSNGMNGPWTELARYQGPTNDAGLVNVVPINILPHASSRTTIRLRANAIDTMGTNDLVYFDNLRIDYTIDGIAGTAFEDYNSDGIYNTVGTQALPAVDRGVAGVTVNAYHPDGTLAATTITDANGDYRLALTNAATNYRIEFVNLPAGYQPAGRSAASTNGTSVQFVTGGDKQDLNFGLYRPPSYCQNNPQIGTSCFREGDRSAGQAALGALYTYPYSQNGEVVAPNNVPPGSTTLAQYQQIGTVGGMAYQRATRTAFGGAFLSRGSDYGPDGSGAIYSVNISGTPGPALLIDLNTQVGIDTGVIARAANGWVQDTNAYANVGKMGLGDLDMSDDDRTLYAVNLNQRQVLAIQMAVDANNQPLPQLPNPTVINRYTIPIPANCAAADVRPFALEFYEGSLYLGMVCSAQSLVTGTEANIAALAAARAALRAYVYRFDPVTASFDSTPLLEFPLNYPRRQVNDGFPTAPDNDGEWLPWYDGWRPPYAPDRGDLIANSQPILTDIEFDGDGFMILGLRDRFGNQHYDNSSVGPNGQAAVSMRHGGDLLLACFNGATWQLESGGTCGTRTTRGPVTWVNDASGPGNGEFYYDEYWEALARTPRFHLETAVGSLSLMPGSGEVVVGSYDVIETFESGTVVFNNFTGGRVRAVQVYQPNAGAGKGAGLGDIEIFCNQAPIELGNRVWRDDNANGIQDAGEPVLQNVAVDLYRYNAGVPTLIGRTTTAADGSYYFTSGTDQTDANLNDSVIHDGGIGIRPNTGTNGGNSNYEIRVPNVSGAGIQVPLTGLTLTTANSDSSTNGDSRDSDGTLSGTNAVYRIPFADIGGAGYTRHTYDFGFVPADWGDLPDGNAAGSPNYNTNAAGSPGPSHSIVNGLRMGARIDGETDGQPSPTAAGDDAATALLPNDEDGVTLPTFFAGRSANLTVAVQNTTGTNAELSSFIDWNGDGDFDDSGEVVRTIVPNGTNGNLTLTVNVPVDANVTQHIGARFRLSNTTNLGPDGPATSGEVEDYLTSVTPTYSLGNRVWEDANNDGTRNAGEQGLAGVTVRLLDGSGNPVDNPNQDGVQDYLVTTSSTAGSEGYYRFDNLVAGDYSVEVVAPAGYASSSNGEEPNPNSDVDNNDNGTVAAGTAVRSATVTLGPAATPEPINEADLSGGQGNIDNRANMTVDFGFYRLLSLGNLVWNDTNNNGLVDNNEQGINGVTVELFRDTNGNGTFDAGTDTSLGTTTTAGGGFYRFDGLLPGEYLVVLPATNFAANGPLANFTSSTGSTGTSEPAPGPNNDTDNDDNGTISGTLGAGGLVASRAVTLAAGTEPTNDGDTSASTNLTVDFGFFNLASLGDRVWFDDNRNGLQDAGERGVPGVTATLFRSDGTQLATTTTDGSGTYGFSGLLAGDYYVVFSGLPAGHVFTGRAQGPNDALDSDADTTTGRTQTVTLVPGQNIPTVDAGIYQLAGLGNFVFEDRNRNGLQDATDLPIPGVTVRLLDANGNLLNITTTDAAGAYFFGNLIPGDYRVEFVPPAGYLFTPKDQGGDDAVDSDADTTSGRTLSVTLAAGESNPTLDAGLYRPASLGDSVWEDRNANGLQEPGELGMPNVTVRLLDASGNVISTTTTDAQGRYQFTGLTPALPYQVEFVPPTGYRLTTLDQGNDDTRDSDANRTTGRTTTVTLLSGENNPTLDAGLYRPASLGDSVWEDRNANGLQDAGETGVPNVTVRLLDGNGSVISTTTTDAQGRYLFDGLTPGLTYQVEFVPPAGFSLAPRDQGNDDTRDSDAALTGGRTTTVTLVPGEHNPTLDAGLYRPTSIGNVVWEDRNGNGLYDANEPLIPGVTVHLLNAAGQVIATTVTDAQGRYQFNGLPPGTYQVRFVPPTGFVFTVRDQGNDSTDSDADRTTGETSSVTLVSGENNLTLFAGLYRRVTLGNLVWEDHNNNGRFDTGESGISGVTVNLYRDSNGDGQPDGPPISTIVTDANGGYQFSNLEPGMYLVEVVPPAGYMSSSGRNGSLTGPYEPGPDSDDDTNNDDNGTQVVTVIRSLPITLISGSEPVNDGDTSSDSNLTVDFGLYKPASLGSFVWRDENGNGIQDAGELGVGGVMVTLYDTNGTVIGTTVTDDQGRYRFDNLVPGTYELGFTNLPTGVRFSPPNRGSDATDSDVDPVTGRTLPITIGVGQNNPTIWAGITPVEPTAITLTSFNAGWSNGQLIVRWATGMELNTFGFRLLRSASGRRADAVIVTPRIIAGKGTSQQGAGYSWTDTTAQAGVSYSYWLEEIEVDGTITTYGPAAGSELSAQRRIFLSLTVR